MTQVQLEEYKLFFDSTPVAFIRTDVETGEFLMANKFAAKMLGFSSVDQLITYGNYKKLCPEEDRVALIKTLKRKDDVEKYEIRFTLPNNKVVWALANLHVNCGGTCIEGVLMDITEKKMEIQKVRTNQLKEIQNIHRKIAQAFSAA